tara:strand:+ start:179 stop:379 length:201 start_codon:yes stop_codon:yes gene_type:complete
VCASIRNPPRPKVAKIQVMKVIVLLIVAMTICSCGWKPKVSCTVENKDTIIKDCIERPEFGLSKEF